MRRAFLAVALVALVAPAAASAHARLDTASPDFRQRLERSPDRVMLQFSQVIQPVPDGIVVRSEDGRIVSLPARRGRDRRSLTAEL